MSGAFAFDVGSVHEATVKADIRAIVNDFKLWPKSKSGKHKGERIKKTFHSPGKLLSGRDARKVLKALNKSSKDLKESLVKHLGKYQITRPVELKPKKGEHADSAITLKWSVDDRGKIVQVYISQRVVDKMSLVNEEIYIGSPYEERTFKRLYGAHRVYSVTLAIVPGLEANRAEHECIVKAKEALGTIVVSQSPEYNKKARMARGEGPGTDPTDSRTAKFPQLLASELKKKANAQIFKWDTPQRSVVVLDKDKFMDKLLPKLLPGSEQTRDKLLYNFSIYMNHYGFSKERARDPPVYNLIRADAAAIKGPDDFPDYLHYSKLNDSGSFRELLASELKKKANAQIFKWNAPQRSVVVLDNDKFIDKLLPKLLPGSEQTRDKLLHNFRTRMNTHGFGKDGNVYKLIRADAAAVKGPDDFAEGLAYCPGKLRTGRGPSKKPAKAQAKKATIAKPSAKKPAAKKPAAKKASSDKAAAAQKKRKEKEKREREAEKKKRKKAKKRVHDPDDSDVEKDDFEAEFGSKKKPSKKKKKPRQTEPEPAPVCPETLEEELLLASGNNCYSHPQL